MTHCSDNTCESQFVRESDILSDEFLEARTHELEQRLSPQRFEHTFGVMNTAKHLARIYDADVSYARLAGLLHDWDKNYDDDAIRRRAMELDVEVDPYIYEEMPALLHGPTAACALARRYPNMPLDVIRAIEVHTTAACNMTDIDMIVYVADAIEPARRYGDLHTIRSLVGNVSLEELFLTTFQHILLDLITRRKRIFPKTFEVWNHYTVHAHTV